MEMTVYISESGRVVTGDTREEVERAVGKVGLRIPTSAWLGGCYRTTVKQSNALHRAGAVRVSDADAAEKVERLGEATGGEQAEEAAQELPGEEALR
jgi:hypothetical protein